MSIDPTLARTLAAVAEEGTLDRGAARLGLTPSAVSQRLAGLERRIGQRLLVRSTPVALTEAGRVVVDFARRVDLGEQEAAAALGLSSAAAPRIAVAVPSDALAVWFLEALALLTARHAVQVEILREDQDATAGLLASGRVMAAISSRERPLPGTAVTPLGHQVYEAVAAPSWWRRWVGDPERADPSQVTAEALTRAPRIDFDGTDELQAAWLSARGVDPARTPRHLIPSTHELAEAVAMGIGWGMLLPRQVAALRAEGAVLPLGGEPVSTPLFWHVARTPSVVLDELTAAVRAAAADALEPTHRTH